MDEDLIRDVESLTEHPASIEAEPTESTETTESEPEAMIVYHGGSEIVTGFDKLEERMDATDLYPDMPDGDAIPVIRVWYGNEWVDYDYGTITEVNV